MLPLLLILAGCKALEQYGTASFNAEQWREQQKRLSMVWDLSRDKRICTQTTAQIIALLGKPDGYFVSEKYQTWSLDNHLKFVIDIPYGKDKLEAFFLGKTIDTLASFSCN